MWFNITINLPVSNGLKISFSEFKEENNLLYYLFNPNFETKIRYLFKII